MFLLSPDQAEKELAEFMKKVDVVVEVRDARIPASTTHPSIAGWVGPHKTVIVVRVPPPACYCCSSRVCRMSICLPVYLQACGPCLCGRHSPLTVSEGGRSSVLMC